MLKKGFLLASALFCAACAAAEKVDFDQGVDVKGIVSPLPLGAARKDPAPQSGPAEWTVMVYVNGKNNLERDALMNVNQMEGVGSTDQVKIAVELGRMDRYDTSDGGWKGERRYIIQKDNDPKHISSPVLQQLDKADMGDWRHLVDFIGWAKRTAPAKHYMLIVWNHGSGWLKSVDNDIWLRGISYDDESGHHLSTPDMGQALAAAGKLDIYASDACLMQMAEVGYQIKDYADYIVQSEETEPTDGYTYDALLAPLVAEPGMSAESLAKLTAQSYTAHYASTGKGATQSAVKSAALSELKTRLSVWAEAVMAAGETAAVQSARGKAQHFYYSDNKDLLDFVRLVDAASQDAAVKQLGAQLEALIADQVVVLNAATGSAYKNAFGLSIYVPNASYNSDYDALAWAQDGSWPKFVKWALGKSPDPANGGDAPVHSLPFPR
jgi:hypothetical protein